MDIGTSVVIKGELNGSEDLTIEGQVEGTIQLLDHVLTIGPNGRIKAHVFAKAVIVLGEVTGNVTASEKVDIRDNGSVDGDIVAPRVAIAEGAHFRGSVDMHPGRSVAAESPSPSDRILVDVHLPTADPLIQTKSLERIQYAVGQLLETFGYEPDTDSAGVGSRQIVHASWHWREWFRHHGPRIKNETEELYEGLKEALRRQQIDSAGAVSFKERAVAAAELIRALELYEMGIVRLGDVILAKAVINGQSRIAVETMSPSLARELEKNPMISRDPIAFFSTLDSNQKREIRQSNKEADSVDVLAPVSGPIMKKREAV
jgi:cytoskeletal protein CcmA (bactofilin family)